MAAVAQPANTKYIHNGSSNGNGDTPSTPWSYSHFQSLAASGALATNTAYKFIAGRYEGQLTISGVVATQSAPVVLEPHDGGEAVFTGSRDVNTGWTWDNTVNCWKTTDLPSGLTHIHNLYDGANGPYELQQLAQRNNNGFYQPQALFPGSGTLVDPALPLASAKDLTGARILYRYANWGYAYAVVTDHDVNASNQPRLHFPTVVSSDTWNGTWGYNLLDRLDFLDAPGEWFHDRTAQPNVLYYNNGSSSTSPTVIRVSGNIQNWGMLMNKLQPGNTANEWVTIRGLRFEHFDDELYPPILDSQYTIDSYRNNSANYPRGTGIRIDRGLHKNITIEHCVFSDLRFGIENFMPAEYSRDMSYLDNTFQRVYSNAIRCGIYDARIERNTFLDIARVPGQAFSDFGFNVALIVASDGFVVRHNRFIGLGGSGIAVGPVAQVSGGPEANVVEHNYLNPGLLTLNDHGAITFDKCESVLIRENIVVDMEGNSETSAGGDFQKDRTVGIYTGYVAPVKNVNLVRNIVTGVGTGINVDHAPEHANNTYSGNTVFACRGAQLNLFDGGIPGGNQYEPAFSSNFHGNILYCTKAEQHPVDILQVKALAWQGGSRPRVDFGSFNGNFYFNPFSDITHYMGFFRDDFSGVGNYVGSLAQPRDVPFTLQSWRALVEPTDASTRSPLRLKDYAVLGNPAVVATHSTECTPADATWSNADALPGDGSVDGHYKRFVDLNFCERWAGSGFPGVTAVTTGSATPLGELYRITFSARSNTTDAIRLAPLVNFNSLAIDPSAYVSLSPVWTEQEALIDLSSPNDAHRFVISFQNAQRGMGALTGSTTVDIDHVRTDIVTLDPDYYASEVEPNHILRFNCPLPGTEHVMNAGASFTVPGDPGQCWSDVHGNFYAAGDEITLDEWASIILFRMDVPDANLALNGSGEHHIVENTLWTDNMNVEGSVVVNDGFTLTIDGAHIGFAASTPSLTTNITVQPGGTLVLRNGATLRNWMGCGSDPGMWDGVKALGTGTTAGAGLVVMESGGSIMDAHTAIRCAEGDVGTIFGGDTEAGGIVQATDAIFENNEYDVVSRPHTIVNPNAWGPSGFTRCTFRRTRALHDATAEPGSRISLMQSAPTEFIGCTFENTSGVAPTDPGEWGFGIHAINTRIRVVRDEVADKRGSFKGLSAGILHSAYEPTAIAVVDECDFSGNGRGLLFWGTDNSNVTRCTFSVADVQVEDLSVEGAYGAYLYGCSGFEVEENSFTGPEGTHPTVGMVLRDCMQDDNMFYNNRFNGFADPTGSSAGSIIMGNNANTDQSVGLRIKCNDYSANATNDYDLAFTGSAVNIANEQGALSPSVTAPAGNTFANVDPLTCDGNEERHFFVEDAMNAFTYWHHEPQPQVELVPHCSNAPNTNSNSNWDYEKTDACPVDLSGLIPIEDDDASADDAHAEHEVLVHVYGDWSDGGDTEGLSDYIMDPANDSYAVRNKLMLVAPSVSEDAWKQVMYERTPPLTPWHLAQALLANSPLEPSVLAMLDTLPINYFYKELVYGGQSGVSMHSIYQSEIAHFYAKKTIALQAMVRKSLLSGDSADIALTRARLTASKTVGEHEAQLALYLAEGDQSSARNLIDARLQGPDHLGYWQVQDLLLGLAEQNKGPAELDANGVNQLRSIAATEKAGAAQAMAWLALLGEPTPEQVLLPAKSKRRKPQRERTTLGAEPMLTAYPNPSNGPVYLVYQVPEGVEQAELVVSDAQGRLLKRERMAPKDGILEVLPRDLASGLHIAALYFDGILVGTTKLNLLR